MFNILDFIFLNLAFFVTVTGSLINTCEKYLPAFVLKIYKYGSFAYTGSDASYLNIFEIPKSFYRHFYIFSSIFSISALLYMFAVYFLHINVHNSILFSLKILLQAEESSVCVTGALLAMLLLTVQCWKRLYETLFLQVFAKSSKININHYLAGLLHYFACVVAIIGEAPLFVYPENRSQIAWIDNYTLVLMIPCTLIFLWAVYEQLQINIIFANLRCDKKSGKVVTEAHRVPYGRLFKYVSSPHRMCEVIMYTLLLLLVPTKTFTYIYLWVIANQIQTAIQAHNWYENTFKTYPRNRKAIVPHVL